MKGRASWCEVVAVIMGRDKDSGGGCCHGAQTSCVIWNKRASGFCSGDLVYGRGNEVNEEG